jgi:asparagine synthase (glutamine-hydrolysing)
MCGIILYKTKDIDKISEPFDLIKERGPDKTTLINVGKYVIGHHRLSIVNIDSGAQPIVIKSDNKIYTLVCNGEIYNYKDLVTRPINSDCEVIIDMYIKNKLHLLDGDFAFVLHILDGKEETIITGRDLVGLKPLYLGYNKTGKLVGVSSEMKVLEAIEKKIIIKAHPIATIMNHTAEKNIDLNIKQELIKDDISDIIKEICKRLYAAVKKRIVHSERPLCILCSGGIDSVIISTIAIDIINTNCEPSKKKLELINLSYDESSYDLLYANNFYSLVKSKYPWVKYTKVIIDKEELLSIKSIKEIINTLETSDPNTIRAALPMNYLAKYIKEKTRYKIVLSGEGADELFMGYNYFSQTDINSDNAAKESRRLVNNLHSFDILRAERVFSSNGVELRVPFLDKDFVNYVLNLPGDIRLPIESTEKFLLRKSFENIFNKLLKSDNNQNNLEYRDDAREINGLLYRQKDRLSDGISGKWVPDLLNFITENKLSKLDEKLKKETEYYNIIYSGMFSNKIGISREMPSWIKNVESDMIKEVKEDKILDFGNTTYQQDIKVNESIKFLEPEKIERGGDGGGGRMNLSYDPNVPGVNMNQDMGNMRPDFSNFRSSLI